VAQPIDSHHHAFLPLDSVKFTFLSLVQHNCLGSSSVFHTLFSFITSVENSPHVVALQDVPFWRGLPPVAKGYKFFFPLPSPLYKPRVVTYVSARFMTVVSALPWFFDRGDLMAMNFHSDTGLLESAFTVFSIYNAYSTINRSTSQHTLTPEDVFPTHTFPSLTVGDLNIYHHLSDPARLLSHSELNVSSQ